MTTAPDYLHLDQLETALAAAATPEAVRPILAQLLEAASLPDPRPGIWYLIGMAEGALDRVAHATPRSASDRSPTVTAAA